uniref:Uncharacterized protein n=1 Tax=Sphaerodactylus townsendi TaxID=933632 RepID=A0ACB8F831_9SAUR
MATSFSPEPTDLYPVRLAECNQGASQSLEKTGKKPSKSLGWKSKAQSTDRAVRKKAAAAEGKEPDGTGGPSKEFMPGKRNKAGAADPCMGTLEAPREQSSTGRPQNYGSSGARMEMRSSLGREPGGDQGSQI